MQDLECVEQIPFIQRSLADISVCHLSCSLRATAGGLQMCSMACPLPLSGSAREDITDLLYKLILSRENWEHSCESHCQRQDVTESSGRRQ